MSKVSETHTLFSVIIPTCHRNDELAQCLERLGPNSQEGGEVDLERVQSRDAVTSRNFGEHKDVAADRADIRGCETFQYEVIVTDDGRNTTAEAMIAERFPWVRWVTGPQRGPAANRNNGARHARGKWLVFLDDDCIPDQKLLAAYARASREHPDVSVLEGRIYSDRPRKRMDEEAPINETGGYLWSCNFAIKRALFVRINGFDEQFPIAAMEDVDLRERIKSLGISFPFVSDAGVAHAWRKMKPPSAEWEKSWQYLIGKHPELGIRNSTQVRLCVLRKIHHVCRDFLRLGPSGLPTRLNILIKDTRRIYRSFKSRSSRVA